MKEGVHRENDTTTGHDCWPPTIPATWSPNVRINRRGVVRKGDTTVAHTCDYGYEEGETHSGTYIGTSLARVNRRDVQKCGSPIQCDHGELDYAATCAYGGRTS